MEQVTLSMTVLSIIAVIIVTIGYISRRTWPSSTDWMLLAIWLLLLS